MNKIMPTHCLKVWMALALITLCLLSACGGREAGAPSRVVQEFWELSSRGKVAEAEKLLTTYEASARERGSKSYAQRIVESRKQVTSVTITGERIEGDRASVRAVIERIEGDTATEKVKAVIGHELVKENGQWKIEALTP
jgi:hypothetical protein